MTQPKVTITEIDGALGVLPPSSGALFALVGPCTSGTANTPVTFGKVRDVQSWGTQGPLVEAAAHYIERYGKPVLLVRTADTVAGASGTLTFTGTGTSVVTADDVTSEPRDDYEVVFLVVTGGTIGVTGITFRYSLDGGRNYSALVSLGVANTYTIPNSGCTLDFAAGTLVAADKVTYRTSAPCWNASELGAALDALGLSVVVWELCEIVGPIDATAFDTIELKFAGFNTSGKPHAWIGNTRTPNLAESEATYLTSLSTAFSDKTSTYGVLCAGACKMVSSVVARKYRRPISYAYAAREAFVSHEVNTADVNLGALDVSIRDENGNTDEHDESANPGLDDARFCVLRTFNEAPQGVYINRPRLFSAEGSDFQLLPHRRVMNLGHKALRSYFTRRLNKPILVDANTGYILESEAREIEKRATAILRAELLAKPKASGVSFVLSRTDNLLSTKKLTGQARIIPLAYPEFIELDIGFENPALQVQVSG